MVLKYIVHVVRQLICISHPSHLFPNQPSLPPQQIADSNLSGTIPTEIGLMTDLEKLNLRKYVFFYKCFFLTFRMPTWCKITSFIMLYVNSCHFHSVLPYASNLTYPPSSSNSWYQIIWTNSY